MDFSLLERARAFLQAHRRKNIWYRTMCGLAAIVVFITTYMLILPAITMERETICGIEEHHHTDDCYEVVTIDPPMVFNCTKDTLEIHVHEDSCYDAEHNLICGYANFVIHTHDKNCYDADGKLVCTLPEIKEHRHTASCYQEEKNLICTKEESEGHKHTADCCEKEKGSLKCTIEEHEHTDECYDESGTLICETSEHQHDDNCYEWNDVLTCTKQESEGHKHTDTCYETVRTLTCSEQEAYPHTHTDGCYEDGKLACGKLETIEHQHTDDCWKADGEATTEKNLICGKEEHEHGEECYKKETESAESTEEDTANVPMLLAGDDEEGSEGESEGEGITESTETPLLPVTKLSGNETEYNPTTDLFETKVRIEFQFNTNTGMPTAGTIYTYTYPEGITIPDDIVNKGVQNLMDGDKYAGTYQFVNNGDGTYSVQVIFDATYINESGDTITGFVQFEGNFGKEDMNKDGDIVVGADDAVILVPGKDITYPKDETESYNIDVSKSGSWVQDGDKLVYTVYIRTTKGTPNPISFEDVITVPDGVTVGEPVVEVQKYIRHIYGEYNQQDATEGTIISVASNYANNTITMSLPGLDILDDQKHGDYDTAHNDLEFYKVTYTYQITDQTAADVVLQNNVSVSAEDKNKGQTITDNDESTINVSKDFSYTLNKSGVVASDKPGYVKWIITVNNNEVNIDGAKLTDDMLGFVEDVSGDIAIEPDTGVTITKDTNGKITDISFDAIENGVNKNRYTITYYTPVEESWDGSTVTNTVKLDPKPDATGDEKEISASVTVSGVKLDKSGTYNGTTNKIDWIITVNSGNLDIAGATLTDDMFAVLSEEAFTIDQNTGYSFTKDADGKITGITFTEVEEGRNTLKYIIKYSTDVAENEDGSINSVTNSAELSPGSGKEGNPIGVESTVTPENIQISKNGEFNWNGYINWTITVNSSNRNIAGAVLSDEMFSQLTTDSITVRNGNWQEISAESGEYTIKTDENGKITGIEFNAIGETGVNTNKYFATYSVDVMREWDDRNVQNEAKLTVDGKDIHGTANVTVPGDGSIAKSAGTASISEDGSTLTIPWTVTLTIPKGGLAEGTIIEDDVTKNQYNNTNNNQWMTRSQIIAWGTNLIWIDDDGNKVGETNTYNPSPEQVTFLASDGNTYTYKQINEYQASEENNDVDFDALAYTLFNICFPEGLIPPTGATKLTFTYSTTADLTKTNIGSNTFYNDIKVGGKETGADYTYLKSGVVKTDGNGSTDKTYVSNDGTLTWKINATVGDGNTKLTLIDTLPADVTLESLQLTGWSNLNMNLVVEGENISSTDSTNQYNVSGTLSDNVITLDIIPQTDGNTIQTGAAFTLVVTCTVNDAANQTETKTLTNTVEMKLDDSSIGASSHTQEWTYQNTTEDTKVVDKSGSWDNSNRIMNYTVILNAEGKDLVEGSDTLTLIDTLTYINQVWLSYPFNSSVAYSINASLIQSSVKLYKAVWDADQEKWVAGEVVSDWSWTYEAKTGEYDWNKNNATNTITATGIPDGIPLMLQYSYRITSNVPDKENNQNIYFNLSFNNKAMLEGTNHKGESSSSNTKWEHSDAAAGVTTDKSYTFYKVEAGNYNVSLADAIFSVYKYDTDKQEYGSEAVKTYFTNGSGSFHIMRQEKDSSGNVVFNYETNTLYKVVETSPPEGYKMPDSVKTYYFYFSSTGDTEHTLPSSIPSDAVDLSSEARTVYVENVKNTTEITVEKKWQDKDGNSTTHTGGSVTLQLYQKTNNGSSPESGNTGIEVGVTASGKNGATITPSKTTVTIGSKIQIKIILNYQIPSDWTWTPSVQIDGIEEGTTNGWVRDNPSVYVYEGVVSEEVNIICSDENAGNISIEIQKLSDPVLPSDPSESEDTGVPYGEPVTITESDGWKYVFKSLPLSGEVDNTTVHYSYYVKEEKVLSYTNIDASTTGVTSGTIIVTNKADENPSYELPETGGPGTRIAYTLGSILMLTAAAFLYIKKKKMGEKGGLK